ncbi:hypothetical protein HDU67_008473 [Dinochytrium kinnereticum]|nr:hypothetical protein HDU67_008473 [Dinochytrium kinnereticum]
MPQPNAARSDAVPQLLLWMATGGLAFSSFLAALSTWELLSEDASISMHLTRTSIAGLIVPDLLAFLAAWRLTHVTTRLRTVPKDASGVLFGITMMQFILAFVSMVGMVQSGERTGGSRALLALLVLVIMLARQREAIRGSQLLNEATADETRPLVEGQAPVAAKTHWPSGSGVGSQLVVMILWGLVAFQAVQRGLDAVNYPPRGRLVRIRNGNQVVHIHCQGQVPDENTPTILLDTGLSITAILSWKFIADPLSKTTRVCWIDRPGYGHSETGPMPQTTSNIAEVLKLTLEEAGEKGPFVLVGHSFGGFNIRVFAHANPHITAGLVFLDASHEDFVTIADEIDPINRPGSASMAMERSEIWNGVAWGLLSPFGIDRILLGPIFEDLWDIKLRPADAAAVFNGRFPKAITSELIHYTNTSSAQARATKPPLPLKTLPVAVVVGGNRISASCPHTATRCENSNATATAWERCQLDLHKSLSENSMYYVARGAGHMVMLDEPGTVMEAISGTVDRAKKRALAMKGKLDLGDLKITLPSLAVAKEEELERYEDEGYDL